MRKKFRSLDIHFPGGPPRGSLAGTPHGRRFQDACALRKKFRFLDIHCLGVRHADLARGRPTGRAFRTRVLSQKSGSLDFHFPQVRHAWPRAGTPHGRGSQDAFARVERIREPVAQVVERQGGEEDHQAWKNR